MASLRAAFQPKVQTAAQKHNIDPRILDHLLQQESGYDPDVVYGRRRSTAGAIGVGQFMPATAREMGVNPLDPDSAIDGAARYLRAMLDRYDGDYNKAVAAYNAGPGGVDDAIRVAGANGNDWRTFLPGETRSYLSAIRGTLVGEATTPQEGEERGSLLDRLTDIPLGPKWTADQLRKINPFTAVTTVAEGTVRLLNALLDPTNWARAGFTLLGGALIVAGFVLYIGPGTAAKAAVSATPAGRAAIVAEGVGQAAAGAAAG